MYEFACILERSVIMEWLIFRHCIRNDPGSNLGSDCSAQATAAFFVPSDDSVRKGKLV